MSLPFTNSYDKEDLVKSHVIDIKEPTVSTSETTTTAATTAAATVTVPEVTTESFFSTYKFIIIGIIVVLIIIGLSYIVYTKFYAEPKKKEPPKEEKTENLQQKAPPVLSNLDVEERVNSLLHNRPAHENKKMKTEKIPPGTDLYKPEAAAETPGSEAATNAAIAEAKRTIEDNTKPAERDPDIRSDDMAILDHGIQTPAMLGQVDLNSSSALRD